MFSIAINCFCVDWLSLLHLSHARICDISILKLLGYRKGGWQFRGGLRRGSGVGVGTGCGRAGSCDGVLVASGEGAGVRSREDAEGNPGSEVFSVVSEVADGRSWLT